MTRLTIDLRDMGAEEDEAPLDPMVLPLKPNPLDEVMSTALERGVDGVQVEFPSNKDAEAARFRFYRRLQKLKKAGIKSFDNLCITISGRIMTLKPYPEMRIL